MASLLDTIASEIHKGFTGKLHTGTLRRITVSGGNDEHGDPVTSTPASHSFEGFIDEYSEFFRMQAGIPEGDLKVCIIAGSLDTTPIKDDRVTMTSGPHNGRTFQLRRIATDPAAALWVCQAFRLV